MKPIRFHSMTQPQLGIGHFFDGFRTRSLADFIGRDDQVNTLPAVNIRETDTEFVLELAAPGMAKEDFTLRLEANSLRISGTKSSEQNQDEGHIKRREFAYRSFERKFPLPEGIQRDAIEASYTDGILQISIPKAEEAKTLSQSIEIK